MTFCWNVALNRLLFVSQCLFNLFKDYCTIFFWFKSVPMNDILPCCIYLLARYIFHSVDNRKKLFLGLENHYWGLQSHPGCWIHLLLFRCFEFIFFWGGVESWNLRLNFSTFSVGGCWGQPMLLFWKVVDENSNVQTSWSH